MVCLQELKATDNKFPWRAIENADYRAVWHGQKGWNGVAILEKDMEPYLTRYRTWKAAISDISRRPSAGCCSKA